MHSTIYQLIQSIAPFDQLEENDIENALEWINSGVDFCRKEKPNIPPKHLVAYFVVLDPDKQEVLLVDHKRAALWLPPGGHVEEGEHPLETVKREAQEELGLDVHLLQENPFFLTITTTSGNVASHLDVSLWYLVYATRSTPLQYCKTEFNGIKWFAFDEIPLGRTDMHMQRFLDKLRKARQAAN